MLLFLSTPPLIILNKYPAKITAFLNLQLAKRIARYFSFFFFFLASQLILDKRFPRVKVSLNS